MATAAVSRAPQLRPEDAEDRFLLRGVPWWLYVALRDELEGAGVRMTYLKGSLELMSPSDLHEESKSLIARLVEVWAEEKDVDLRAFGSTTFRHEVKERGLEPDECYVLGPRADEFVPHIAIEVVVRSPLLDKLAVYAGLGVPEVWIWRPATQRLEVHRLAGDTYTMQSRSDVVPDLDLALLAHFVRPGESHTTLARAFRAALQGS